MNECSAGTIFNPYTADNSHLGEEGGEKAPVPETYRASGCWRLEGEEGQGGEGIGMEGWMRTSECSESLWILHCHPLEKVSKETQCV